MSKRGVRRGALLVAVLAGLAPLLGAAAPGGAKEKTAEYTGKVVPLAELVAKAGSRLDADAAATSLVLVGDDGKVYPLVKDGGARLFFQDKALLKRPMRLTALPLPGSQILRVQVVHSLVKGVPHEVYYWCDVCSIRRGEKSECECCGGPMERKEEAVK